MSDPRRMSERELHIYVADLLRLTGHRDVMWLHVPNESPRSSRYGAQLVRYGLKAGAADILVVVRGKTFWLELKTARGRLSPEQWAFREAAVAAGAAYEVVRTPEQAKEILASWGALRPDSIADILRNVEAVA